VKDPTLEWGQSVRSPPPEEEGVTETACDELTVTPIPRPPALLEGRRERNRSEPEPGEEGRGGGKVFEDLFLFSHSPTLISLVMN